MAGPPLWLLFSTQTASVLGDAMGQRVRRTHHRRSRMHMFLTFTVISGLQVLVILGVLQLALPTSVTGAIYIHGEKEPCWRETEYGGATYNCTARVGTPDACEPVSCPSQGPGSMFRSIGLHPLLLLNGVLSLVYYSAELSLYGEPLALVLLVMASLTSSFLINPLQRVFGIEPSTPPKPLVFVFGILGALLFLLEREGRVKKRGDSAAVDIELVRGASFDYHDLDGARRGRGSGDGGGVVGTPPVGPRASVWARFRAWLRSGDARHMARRFVRLLLPVVVLAVVYSTWFVNQVFFNNRYRVNAFGYNALDQVLGPFFAYPFLFVCDRVRWLRPLVRGAEDWDETFEDSVRQAWRDVSWRDMFTYRLLINGRAFVLYYIAILYDLETAYLELTLMKIVMSWAAAMVLCLLVPRWMSLSAQERADTFAPFNIALKITGTALIVVSFVLLH